MAVMRLHALRQCSAAGINRAWLALAVVLPDLASAPACFPLEDGAVPHNGILNHRAFVGPGSFFMLSATR
jgi:hypothetical protein